MGDITPVPNWFSGSVPCPTCWHTCFDHCVCRTVEGVDLIDPPCLCDNEAHLSGRIQP